ncbi:hypothetical protein OY671_010208, partial [Metschnikowia pulcherrima]
GASARAFKGAPSTIPSDLPERTEAASSRASTDRSGIESRAGNMSSGTEKIAQGCRAGAVTFSAHASDAGSDGPNKSAQAWRGGEEAEGTGSKGIILPSDRAASSVALGRDNVVHSASTDDAAAARVAAPLQRSSHFMGRDEKSAGDVAASVANDDFDTKGE